MWIFTPFGFFSVVQKSGTDFLTIRARDAGDLDQLREGHLPELSQTISNAGTDYPYRATCTHAEFAAAQVKIALSINYSNFKSEVATSQGPARANLYQSTWEILLQLEHAASPAARGAARPKQAAPRSSRMSYGGVILDDEGRVLLRKVKGDFGGARWTFPKGRPDSGEEELEAANREVLEETGYTTTVLRRIPGEFRGTTGKTIYWAMRAVEQVSQPDPGETDAVEWFTPREARERIRESPSKVVCERDLDVLEAALAVFANMPS
jgi:8-oxo-dGTP pyrophosphatase MutT (NUDIX family)